MIDTLKKCPGFCVFGGVILALFLFLETSGWASAGSKAPERVDPKQIRSSSPGSWHFVYWNHGIRGK